MAIGLLSSALAVGALPAVSATEISWEIRNKGGKVAATELALQGLPTSENPFDSTYADVIAKVTDPSGNFFLFRCIGTKATKLWRLIINFLTARLAILNGV